MAVGIGVANIELTETVPALTVVALVPAGITVVRARSVASGDVTSGDHADLLDWGLSAQVCSSSWGKW
jgi:hypothetical protein